MNHGSRIAEEQEGGPGTLISGSMKTSLFLTNKKQSRFVLVVYNGVLGPPRHTDTEGVLVSL